MLITTIHGHAHQCSRIRRWMSHVHAIIPIHQWKLCILYMQSYKLSEAWVFSWPVLTHPSIYVTLTQRDVKPLPSCYASIDICNSDQMTQRDVKPHTKGHYNTTIFWCHEIILNSYRSTLSSVPLYVVFVSPWKWRALYSYIHVYK